MSVRRLAAVLLLLAVLFCGNGQAATVSNQMITKVLPPAGACSPIPAPASNTLTTDKEAGLFFILRDVRVGDVVATEWTAPDGSIPDPSGAYPPETQAGDWCYKERLQIAGGAGARSPGSWRVRAYLNGTLLFTLNFTISQPSTVGGLTLNITQVITTGCPKLTFIASVTDSAGKPVGGLAAPNFTLKEDGQVQNITVTSTASGGSGLSVALVIDHSGSVSGQPMADEKSAAKALVAQLGAADAVAVFSFGTMVEPLQDFSTDKNRVNSAIDSITAGGNTALYAAVVAAAQKLAPRTGRKAIVVMTDGENNQSGTIDDCINQAKLAGAPVFTVGFGSVNASVMTRMAKDTGGTYAPAADSSSLVAILQNIGAVISTQYEITYTSSSPSSNHTVDLTAQSGGSQSVTVARSVNACQGTGGASVTLKVENTSAAPAAAVDVPVTLTATTPPSTFQYDLTYDASKLTFVQAKQGDQTRAASKDIATNPLSSNSLRVVAAGLNQGLMGNGTVVLMNFRLNSGFTSGSTNLACSNAVSADALSKAITPTTCQGGTLTVRSTCSCDVNGDGVVNVLDVQLIANQTLGVVAGNCDINGDGQTNVLDVQMVINATLGLGCK